VRLLGSLLGLRRFRNGTFLREWVNIPTSNPPTWRTRGYISSGTYPLTCLAWVALLGAYAPASIDLRVIWARKYPRKDMAVVSKEEEERET
jgi:hypothetical protein